MNSAEQNGNNSIQQLPATETLKRVMNSAEQNGNNSIQQLPATETKRYPVRDKVCAATIVYNNYPLLKQNFSPSIIITKPQQ